MTDPDMSQVEVLEALDALLASAKVRPLTQAELLTGLDELLDNAQHTDQCYINPDATECACIIGRVRAVLPRCQARQYHTVSDAAAFDGQGQRVWRCQRSIHPAQPGRHYYSEA